MKKILILLWCSVTTAWSADPQLTAELSSRNAFLGDAVTLLVRISHDENWLVEQKEFAAELGDATVLSHQWQILEKQEGSNLSTVELRLKLAWYRLGEFKLPPFEITLLGEDVKKLLETPELTIEIVTMLAEEDKDLAPAKDQVDLEVPLLWPWILGAVLLLLVVAGLIYHHFFRTKGKDSKPPPPPKPPYEEAILALNTLTSGSLLKEGRVKEFHVAITLIIRHYYGRLFGINSEEMTSFELEEWLENESHRLPGELFYLNRAFQEQCDRVKYAKHDPVEAENKETTNRAYQVVEKLKAEAQEARHVATS